MQIIKFGDIFLHNEKEYVFLAKTEEIIYTAQILCTEHTQQIHELYKRESKKPNNKCSCKPLFCYIILRTEEFKDRMATLKKTDDDGADLLLNVTSQQLCKEDILELKGAIINEDSPIPLELKSLVKGLDIK